MGRFWRRPGPAVLGVVAISVALSVIARVGLGARGELVPSMLLATSPGSVAGFIGLRWLRGARDPKLSATNRRIVAAMALLPLAFAAFCFWQAALVAVDLVSPFEVITAEVVGSRYTPAARGPGIEHLSTADGAVYSYPLFSSPNADLGGPRTITLSRFQHLVIDVR